MKRTNVVWINDFIFFYFVDAEDLNSAQSYQNPQTWLYEKYSPLNFNSLYRFEGLNVTWQLLFPPLNRRKRREIAQVQCHLVLLQFWQAHNDFTHQRTRRSPDENPIQVKTYAGNINHRVAALIRFSVYGSAWPHIQTVPNRSHS